MATVELKELLVLLLRGRPPDMLALQDAALLKIIQVDIVGRRQIAKSEKYARPWPRKERKRRRKFAEIIEKSKE